MSIEMDDAVAAVRRLNPHPEKYADGRWAPQSNRYEFPIVSKPLTDDMIVAHITGRRILGGVGADARGGTNLVGLDVDAHYDGQNPGLATKRFVAMAEMCSVPTMVHTSKSGKGFHIRTLFKKHIPSFLARALYAGILAYAGLANGQDKDKSVDKIWPPATGRGVLALPYQRSFAHSNKGTLALDPHTLRLIKSARQYDAVLQADELEEHEVLEILKQLGATTESEIMTAAGVPKGLDPRLTYVLAENQDGLQHLFSQCEAVEHVIRELTASTLPRNFWWGMMTNFKPFREGKELYDKISQLDTRRYRKKTFDAQWNSIKGKPRLCENLDPGWTCPRRDTCPARAPAGLAARLQGRERQAKKQNSVA